MARYSAKKSLRVGNLLVKFRTSSFPATCHPDVRRDLIFEGCAMREILPPLRSLRMTRMGYMQIPAYFFAYLACLLYLCTDQSPFLKAVGRRILVDYEAEARVPVAE